jgi:hypothetical protein
MAATLTSTDPLTYVSFPINKWEEDGNGNIVVYGKATDGTVDSDQQIVDPDWSAKALHAWMKSGPNLRVQHNPHRDPAGNGLAVEINRDGDGAHWVRSVVVEPVAKTLVRNGALRAYSVGIAKPVIRRDITGKAKGGIIADGELAELSLVDRPANRNCGITLVKSAGASADGDWSFGDLDDLLAKSSAPDLVKSAKPDLPDDEEHPVGEDDDEATADVTKMYQRARAEWLAREPRPNLGDLPPTSGTALLVKQATQQRWEQWDAEGDTAGLDGTPESYLRWLGKREFDRGVGGGVDRATLPQEDFGDPHHRKYPIVSPGDVSDAAGLIGHAPDPATVRDRITAIAHRKGPAFIAELPDSWTGKSAGGEAHVPDLPDLFADLDTGENDEVAKGAKDCRRCGAAFDADAKLRRCTKCGKKLPKADVIKEKRRPAYPHREPDGEAVEALEHDAGWPTDPDDEPDQVPASVKSYAAQRMHDAVCAAYPWSAVATAYPSLTSVADAVDTDWWIEEARAAAVKGEALVLADLGVLFEEAEALTKGVAEPAQLADARADLHKAFQDMYPDVSVHPTDMAPGRFQRPYISAGHAALNVSGPRLASTPPANTPHPDDYRRPLITAGHQAQPPRDSGDNLQTPSVATGASRTYYTVAARNAARNAMQAMHDHIAGTFPDMCPMAKSVTVLPPDNGAHNRPRPAVPLDLPPAPGETKAAGTDLGKAAGQRYQHGWIPIGVGTRVAHKKTGRTGVIQSSRATKTGDIRHKIRMDDTIGSDETFSHEEIAVHNGPANRGTRLKPPPGLRKKTTTKALVGDLVKSAVAEATSTLADQYEQQLAALKAQVAELESQPDPAQAPMRGVAKRATTEADTAPVERVSLVEKAQADGRAREREERIAFAMQFLNHPDVQKREMAQQQLRSLAVG